MAAKFQVGDCVKVPGGLGIGAMILTVRGWRFANRLLRERRGGG